MKKETQTCLLAEKYDPWLCIPRTSFITHFVNEEYTSQY